MPPTVVRAHSPAPALIRASAAWLAVRQSPPLPTPAWPPSAPPNTARGCQRCAAAAPLPPPLRAPLAAGPDGSAYRHLCSTRAGRTPPASVVSTCVSPLAVPACGACSWLPRSWRPPRGRSPPPPPPRAARAPPPVLPPL
eukprot:2061975-Pleurochrysis_carterae.AAC.1